MEKYLLTIAIPTYNRSKTLERALEAITLQYDERVEILICDDASGDNTSEVVSRASKKIPINYLQNKTNLGFDRNFMQCFQKAQGKFVLIMGDDDFLIQGGLSHILSYISKNEEVEWVHITNGSFEGKCSIFNTNLSISKSGPDKCHVSKKDFLNYAQIDITTLLNIIRRENIQKIQNKEKYIGVNFMQTCLWLEATKADDSVLGIIGDPCIACNATEGDHNTFKNPSRYFEVFFKGMKQLFYVVGPECGYNKKQMKKIFNRFDWCRRFLLRLNAMKVQGWRKAFWHIGFPAICDIPTTYIKILPIVVLPSFTANFLLNEIRPMYKKAKKNIKIKWNFSGKREGL